MRKLLINLFTILCILVFASCEEKIEKNNFQVNQTSQFREWVIDKSTKITYSKHAQCRMECRFIDEEEVREILLENNTNHDKTKITEKGESRAYEGITHDGQKVRIVAAENKPGHIHIVTVIDLKNEWKCAC